MLPDQSLRDAVRQQAILYGVDPALAMAVVEQESNWNTWAMRFEPAFYNRYIEPLPNLTPTESEARAFSWGLFQVMGQTAREQGFQHTFLSMLCDPEIGITVGVRFLKQCLDEKGGDVTQALLRWNGGGDSYYPSQVQQRMAKYQ